MRWIPLALLAALVVAPAATAAAVSETLVLDLTNWGEGIYYLKGKYLGQESNGKDGFQDAPTIVGNPAGDALILP